MEVTYGHDMKGGETFVTSMRHSADIFLSVATPGLFAMCTALPLGVFLLFDPVLLDRPLMYVCCSESTTCVAPRNGVEVQGC